MPVNEIATAIENKNASVLNNLPGVGGRMAEKIIAELHGKTAKFALSRESLPLAKTKTVSAIPFFDEAMDVLSQLQYKPSEAKIMIDSALLKNKKISGAEELISFIFQNESALSPTESKG